MFQSACPIMPSRDFDGTTAFYADLGFEVGARYEKEGYLILRREGAELHFFRYPAHEPETSDHGVYLRVEDAAAVSHEFEPLKLPAEGIPRFHPAEAKPWDMLEVVVVDEDGNLLRIGSDLEAARG